MVNRLMSESEIESSLGLSDQGQDVADVGGALPSAPVAAPQQSGLPSAPDYSGFLTGLYQELFNRAPDQGGYNFWLDALNKGYTPEFVRGQFMSSPEYLSLQPTAAPTAPPTAAPAPAPYMGALSQATAPPEEAAEPAPLPSGALPQIPAPAPPPTTLPGVLATEPQFVSEPGDFFEAEPLPAPPGGGAQAPAPQQPTSAVGPVDDWQAGEGFEEARIVPGFDWKEYVNKNPDLQRAGIDTEQEARRHYALYGYAEDRSGTPTLNLDSLIKIAKERVPGGRSAAGLFAPGYYSGESAAQGATPDYFSATPIQVGRYTITPLGEAVYGQVESVMGTDEFGNPIPRYAYDEFGNRVPQTGVVGSNVTGYSIGGISGKTDKDVPYEATFDVDVDGKIKGYSVNYKTGGDSGTIVTYDAFDNPIHADAYDYSEEWRLPVALAVTMIGAAYGLPQLGAWISGGTLAASSAGAAALGGAALSGATAAIRGAEGSDILRQAAIGGASAGAGALAGEAASSLNTTLGTTGTATGQAITGALQAGAQALPQAIATGDFSNLLQQAAAGGFTAAASNALSSTLSGSGFTPRQIGGAITIATQLASGQPSVNALINAAGQLVDSPNATIAAKAAVMANQVRSGAGVEALLYAAIDLGRAIDAASNPFAGQPGAQAYADAIRAGASDEEAAAAARAVTGGDAIDRATAAAKALPVFQMAIPSIDIIDEEWGDLSGAMADAARRNTYNVTPSEATSPEQAAVLAQSKGFGVFTFGGRTYSIGASADEILGQARGTSTNIRNDEANTPEEAAALARQRGANSFIFGGVKYDLNAQQQVRRLLNEYAQDKNKTIDQLSSDEVNSFFDRINPYIVNDSFTVLQGASLQDVLSGNVSNKPMEMTFENGYYDDQGRFYVRIGGVGDGNVPEFVEAPDPAQGLLDWANSIEGTKGEAVRQALSTSFGLFGEQIADLGTTLSKFTPLDRYNALVRFGERLEQIGQKLEIPGVTKATENWIKGVEEEKTYSGKLAAAIKGVYNNPLALVVGAKEIGQELVPILTGLGVARFFGKAAGVAADVLLNAAESMGSQSRATYREEIEAGKSPREAAAIADRKGWIAGGITAAFAGVADASMLKAYERVADKVIGKGLAAGGREFRDESGEEFLISLATGDDFATAMTKSVIGGLTGAKASTSIQVASDVNADLAAAFAAEGYRSTDGSFTPQSMVQVQASGAGTTTPTAEAPTAPTAGAGTTAGTVTDTTAGAATTGATGTTASTVAADLGTAPGAGTGTVDLGATAGTTVGTGPVTTAGTPALGTAPAGVGSTATGAGATTTTDPATGVSTTTQTDPATNTTTSTQTDSTTGATTATQTNATTGASTTTETNPGTGTTTETTTNPSTNTTTTTQTNTNTGASSTTETNAATGASTTTETNPSSGTSTTTQTNPSTGTSTQTTTNAATGTTTESTTNNATGVTTQTTTGTEGTTTTQTSGSVTTQTTTQAGTNVTTETTTNSETGVTTQTTSNGTVTTETTTNPNTGVTTQTQTNPGTGVTSTTESDPNSNTVTQVTVNNNTGATTETTTDVQTGATTQVTTEGNVTTTTKTNPNTGVTTQVTVDANTNVTTQVTSNPNTGVQTTTTTDSNTEVTTNIDTNTNTKTTVVVRVDTGEIVDYEQKEITKDEVPIMLQPLQPVELVSSVDALKALTPVKAPSVQTPSRSGGAAMMLPAAITSAMGRESIDPRYLRSFETQGYIDPLAGVKQAQAELQGEEFMQQVDPRLAAVLQERMGQQQQQEQDSIGALARMLSGEPEPSNSPYYSYGQEDSIDDIMGGRAVGFAQGGYVAPLMMADGGMSMPLMAKEGGRPREDFREGKHVAGDGDGQSDDIPAWLADGEFVFPADVVSALGNGSTKAGTDKLYEMMHEIRKRSRSTDEEDLPPPALKSPLDYLKSKR